MKKTISEMIKESMEIKNALLGTEFIGKIEEVAQAIIESLNAKGKMIIFGNGGSAADAQHMVCEFVGRFKKERKALPAMSLTTNTSSITAISNDYSYDVSFERQLEAFAEPKDIALGISTSGNAANVINAIKRAKSLKVKTVALTGKDGGELSKVADISVIVPSNDTPRIQEAHVLIIHILCALVEENTT